MRVTLKDIARHMDMNESTVSYALNGKGSIKDKTRELVQKTAREMGYIPNQSARQISTGKSQEVAIVVPNVISIYGEFCEHAYKMLSNAGIRSNISISEFSTEREEVIVQDLIGRGVAGVLISSTEEFDDSEKSHCMDLLKKHRIPVIRRSGVTSYPSVGIDYRRIGIMMGEKLRAQERKHVCLAAPHPPPFYDNINKMLEGLEDILGEETTISIEYIEEKERTESTINYGQVVCQMLTQDWYSYHQKLFHKIYRNNKNKVDAIVSPTDTCIIAMINEAKSYGINIPVDLSLISGTRSILSYMSPNDVTATYVSEKRIAENMVTQLLEKISNNKEIKNIRLKPEFYAGSTL